MTHIGQYPKSTNEKIDFMLFHGLNTNKIFLPELHFWIDFDTSIWPHNGLKGQNKVICAFLREDFYESFYFWCATHW